MIGKRGTWLVLAVFLVTGAAPGICGGPYTGNGLGTQVPETSARIRAMGGAGVASPISRNTLRDNPALLTTFSGFTLGADMLYGRQTMDVSGGGSSTYAKNNLDMIRLILPLWRGIVVGWGITPVTLTDVNLEIPSVQDDITITDRVKITGGITTSHTGVAWAWRDRLRVGLSVNYNFGMIQDAWVRFFPENETLNPSAYYLKHKYRGYSYSYGVVYRAFGTTHIGASFTTKSKLTHDDFIVTDNLRNSDIFLQSDTRYLPSRLRTGVYTRFSPRVEGALDLSMAFWEDAAVTSLEKQQYTDTFTVGGGVRFTPSLQMNAPYWKTMPLSAGFRYGTLYYKSYPLIDTVREAAVTAGLEFPLGNGIGSIITSAEYGWRGDRGKNGWDETFVNFGLSLVGMMK